MEQFEIVIRNPTGLHARPAKIFVTAAKAFSSDVRVRHGEKTANAKSLISMLTLGVEPGSRITVLVDGEDEEAAAQQLEALIASGLGEAELMAEQVGEASAPPAQAAQDSTPVEPVQAPAIGADAPASTTNQVQGVAASPGIAVGPIVQLRQHELKVDETFAGKAEERSRVQEAIARARSQLAALHESMAGHAAAEAAIFDVHVEILEDPELLESVWQGIDRGQSAAEAWQASTDARARLLSGLKDPLLAARSADVRDVGDRVLRLLLGAEEASPRLPNHPVIVVAHDLAPSDTASLDKERVMGFCTAAGGPTAHTAIIARALGIPAVVGAGPAVLDWVDGTSVIVDGGSGAITVDPDEDALREAQAAQQRLRDQKALAERTSGQPALTRDGHRVEVAANAGGLADARQGLQSGAEGIGLLRTEFLFLDRAEAPTEDEQFETYRDIVEAMQGAPVIVRTLDIGGDKPLPYIDVPAEANPFLGERGIRLCLNRPEILEQQLRAILRAASHGTVRIMFPMVADLDEWRAASAMVERVRAELNAPRVQLGIMVEVPSTALMADAFAAEVDFFSVGTNDLTQYTLAMDRMHPLLAGQSDGLHPAVLRLIAKTAEAAHQAGKWLGVCGELGSDPQAVPILVGLGVDELSVSPPAVPLVKAQVRQLALDEAKDLAQRALACATASQVRALTASLASP